MTWTRACSIGEITQIVTSFAVNGDIVGLRDSSIINVNLIPSQERRDQAAHTIRDKGQAKVEFAGSIKFPKKTRKTGSHIETCRVDLKRCR